MPISTRGQLQGLPKQTIDRDELVVQACENALQGMRDAMDLVLIHNEVTVRGDVPRATLNPLIVLLAASAWERLVHDVAKAFDYKGGSRKAPLGALSPHESGGDREAKEIFAIATANGSRVLPDAWTVTFYNGWTAGKRLGGPTRVSAATDFEEFARIFDDYRTIRNGVAHRVVPEKMAGVGLESDALSGRTINTSIARPILAAYIQLVDQSIGAVLDATGLPAETAARLRLPVAWFDDDVDVAGSRALRPGCLWGGVRIPRI